MLPNTSAPVAQKMFFKADKCNIQWSPNGKHLLAMSQTEVDSTGKSYYGETNLYFVSGDGAFDCRVTLDREGPIHDFAWSPSSGEFIVLYGYMPSTNTLFDMKCEPVFTFPVGSKNHIRWNAQGSLICFGGFGNLPGQVEVWSRLDSIRRVGHFQAQGASVCEWAPDGATIISATLTPRLRVDNGFKLWSWQGRLLESRMFGELYSASWRWMNPKLFPAVDTSSSSGSMESPASSIGPIERKAYRPPGLRDKGTLAPPSGGKTNPAPKPNVNVSIPVPSTLSREEKQVKRLKEKLDQIENIKERIEAGQSVELNQLDKVKREAEVRREYNEALLILQSSRPQNHL